MINIEAVESSVGRRLQDLMERARGGPVHVDESLLEQWLQCWNDDDSVAGNLRNLEYWLATHSTGQAVRSAR